LIRRRYRAEPRAKSDDLRTERDDLVEVYLDRIAARKSKLRAGHPINARPRGLDAERRPAAYAVHGTPEVPAIRSDQQAQASEYHKREGEKHESVHGHHAGTDRGRPLEPMYPFACDTGPS